MKNQISFLSVVTFLMVTFWCNAQTEYVKQIIIAEGAGTKVYVSSYNPSTMETTVFDSLDISYVQDLIVSENYAYVSANDSIIKYNIDTYERLNQVFVGNVHKLAVYGDKLIVGRWLDPADSVFVKVLNTSDLSEAYGLPEIDDQTYGIAVAHDTAYVAVFGGYGHPEGYIAVVDLSTQSWVRNIELGTDGEGIGNMFTDGYNVYFVSETYTWTGDTIGSVGIYGIESGEMFIDFYQEEFGRGYAINGTAFFIQVNGNLGTYDLYGQHMINTELIAGPGGYDAISTAVFDRVNYLFYVSTTDYYSYGQGTIYDIYGTQNGTFEVGIAADAMAIDYRTGTSSEEVFANSVNLYPNPAVDKIIVDTDFTNATYEITDMTGRKMLSGKLNDQKAVNLQSIPSGLYMIRISNGHEAYNQRIIILK